MTPITVSGKAIEIEYFQNPISCEHVYVVYMDGRHVGDITSEKKNSHNVFLPSGENLHVATLEDALQSVVSNLI